PLAHLPWRAFHIVGRWRLQRTSFAALQRQLRAAYCIDDDAGAIRRILNRQSPFQFNWRAPEAAPLHADEAHLIVLLPRHVIGRTNMYVSNIESLVQLRLDGFGLRDLF